MTLTAVTSSDLQPTLAPAASLVLLLMLLLITFSSQMGRALLVCLWHHKGVKNKQSPSFRAVCLHFDPKDMRAIVRWASPLRVVLHKRVGI